MKKLNTILIFAVIIFIAVGGWFAYDYYRQNKMLSSGEPLLLVNAKNSLYAFSEDVPFDMLDDLLDGGFKARAYSNRITDEELQNVIGELQRLHFTVLSEDMPQNVANVYSPESEQQANDWLESLNLLEDQQKIFCEQMNSPETVQFCLFRHLTWKIIKNDLGESLCNTIFADVYREQCHQDWLNRENVVFNDKDNNSLLDVFENSLSGIRDEE